jgi:hypothetical protein
LEEISLSGAYPIPELTGSKIFPNKTKKIKKMKMSTLIARRLQQDATSSRLIWEWEQKKSSEKKKNRYAGVLKSRRNKRKLSAFREICLP